MRVGFRARVRGRGRVRLRLRVRGRVRARVSDGHLPRRPVASRVLGAR